MIAWVEKNTAWQYVLRTSPQIYVQADPKQQSLRDYPLEKGSLFHLHQVGFTKTAEVVLNVIGWWASRYDEPIFLVTNLPNAYQACRYYRRRFRIETFFSDQKSRGVHIHKSHLSDPARLSRILIAACRACLWMICQGLQVVASNMTNWIDRSEPIDKSLLRLGLDSIKQALKHRLDFQPLLQSLPLQTLVHVRQRILFS